ncbi:hypothetical protein QCD85_22905 [Paenibacillus sp. PsM32]|uniref:hypothetical protein n=1 Tax=Paenibacillus sp. PsM32 TaxID=3030536 RepID=UPI00263B3BA7|nr:hypothetical protein [Paenibacillus sp. PsM32]MDN4620985.1 hypothetical protein [Paenibacillus sp. PsM32]
MNGFFSIKKEVENIALKYIENNFLITFEFNLLNINKDVNRNLSWLVVVEMRTKSGTITIDIEQLEEFNKII